MYQKAEYVAVTRAIGYQEIPYSVLWPKLQALAKEFGRDKIDKAERDLIPRWSNGTQLTVKLKPELRVNARQLLGPLPEEAADWNKGLVGTQSKAVVPKPP